ncbi:MAG: ACP S-malonyltransferase [Ginsengibacter sp.]
MAHAFIFPGQGSQFIGMGKNLFDEDEQAKLLFQEADDVLGFSISDVMFYGTADELKQTSVTQPAVFLHSVIAYKTLVETKPGMVAGHSLGEFSALVANGCLSFTDALKLVSVRAKAMQKACEINPSTMAAILGLEDKKVEEICASVINEIVVPANYNCPGQIVISGSVLGIEEACTLLKAAGAKRALILPVGGAFHSPLMQPAKEELSEAIQSTRFNIPFCPVYQNVTAKAVTEPEEIKSNLIAQLTGPVKWTQTIEQMIFDGASLFTECGPGKVLQGLVSKIKREMAVNGIG